MAEWNVDRLCAAILRRSKQLESRINEIKRYKIERSPFYKTEHDECIGALQVNIQLENSVSLISRASLIAKLKEMQKEKPIENSEMFDFDNVIKGYQLELADKLKELE